MPILLRLFDVCLLFTLVAAEEEQEDPFARARVFAE
jgi:hypothetical protein